MPILITLMLASTTGRVPADVAARVPASRLQQEALQALAAKATQAGVEGDFVFAARMVDVPVPTGKQVSAVQAHAPERWLSSRVAVPVRIAFSDGSATSTTAWFAVSVPARGLVYSTAYPGNAAGAQVAVVEGDIDLARTHGEPMVSAEALPGLRLRRAVRDGAPALASDFQPMPVIAARQDVRIDAVVGGVRLSMKGRALRDGAIGQVIPVLPSHGTRSVKARVDSSQVVTLEN
jgi:flagella basal body P-ring formation protein FlgA